jgi:Tfp pilus assembly protein PilN
MIEGKNRLQLLPEKRKKIYIKSRGENNYFFIGIAFLILIIVSALFVDGYRGRLESRALQLDTQIQDLNNQRDKQREEELQNLSKQIAQVSNLLDGHVFWSEAFSRVESLIGSQVQVNNLEASVQEKSISFTAFTVNYTSVARQIASFLSSDLVKDVSLKSSKLLNSGRVEFSMELEFNDDFLKK